MLIWLTNSFGKTVILDFLIKRISKFMGCSFDEYEHEVDKAIGRARLIIHGQYRDIHEFLV